MLLKLSLISESVKKPFRPEVFKATAASLSFSSYHGRRNKLNILATSFLPLFVPALLHSLFLQPGSTRKKSKQDLNYSIWREINTAAKIVEKNVDCCEFTCFTLSHGEALYENPWLHPSPNQKKIKKSQDLLQTFQGSLLWDNLSSFLKIVTL